MLQTLCLHWARQPGPPLRPLPAHPHNMPLTWASLAEKRGKERGAGGPAVLSPHMGTCRQAAERSWRPWQNPEAQEQSQTRLPGPQRMNEAQGHKSKVTFKVTPMSLMARK